MERHGGGASHPQDHALQRVAPFDRRHQPAHADADAAQPRARRPRDPYGLSRDSAARRIPAHRIGPNPDRSARHALELGGPPHGRRERSAGHLRSRPLPRCRTQGRAAPLCRCRQLTATKRSLAADLRSLGLKPGDSVLVHAALRSIVPIVGGADMLLAALRDVLGAEGTVLAYTDWQSGEEVHTAGADRNDIPPFDPLTSRSTRDNGWWPELVRTTPG